jgi:quinol monooxygenase YgiN
VLNCGVLRTTTGEDDSTMATTRRQMLLRAMALATGSLAFRSEAIAGESTGGVMYGLIGKISAVAGQRDALAAILLEGTKAMPGCLSYVVAADAADPDGLWVTEVWESEESHKASLTLPAVQTAIAKGKPLIAKFSNNVATVPLGGHGLSQAKRS